MTAIPARLSKRGRRLALSGIVEHARSCCGVRSCPGDLGVWHWTGEGYQWTPPEGYGPDTSRGVWRYSQREADRPRAERAVAEVQNASVPKARLFDGLDVPTLPVLMVIVAECPICRRDNDIGRAAFRRHEPGLTFHAEDYYRMARAMAGGKPLRSRAQSAHNHRQSN